MLCIRSATIFTPGREIKDGTVLVDGARIVAAGPGRELPCPDGSRTIDASGLLLTPGLIELQLNGAFGHDFTADPTSIWDVADRLPCYGVTSFLPTIVTSPLETVASAQEVVAQPIPPQATGALPLGLHVEGPFLNPQKKGAHNPAYLRRPDLAAIRDWSPEQGVRLVTLAPELPGALDLISALAERGVVVSAGHSAASYAQALSGIEAGIRYGTHLFNAMSPLHQRQPGLIGALLTDPRPTVGMIGDGIHTHPAVMALAWQAWGSRRLSMVSDAMAALGMPPGQHLLGDYRATVDEQVARLEDGTLAGSIQALDRVLRNLINFTGCSLAEALPTVTTTPAALLGLAAERGSVAPGQRADLVLFTPALEVHTTIVAGKIVYESQPG
jgi:N-acetylglucosamine-6-phosphate deacetylase